MGIYTRGDNPTMNMHPLTGAPLQQPDPAPLRRFALYDRDKPCVEHSGSYTGRIPCTGAYRCHLCGTEWNEQGQAFPPRQGRR